MRRRILGAACLISLACAAAASAQGTDTPVLLRYHFQPGQEFHYRLTLNGDMGMSFSGITPPPGANMPGKIPITLNGTYEFSQKVKSVTPDGVATVSASLDKMEMTTGMMGMNIVGRLGANGKMETLMNGQPITLPNAPNASFTNPIYEGTVDPTGKIAGVNPDSLKSLNQLFGGQNIASMFNGMPGVGGLVLPSQPIKPGDTWDQKFDLHMPIPMPGMAGAAPGGLPAGANLNMSFVMHNKLLRVEDGRAIIETTMSATMPTGSKMPLPTPAGANAPPGMKMSIDKMVETMTGTQRFNTEQGASEGGDFDATMAMAMSLGLPPGMSGTAPGPKGQPAPKKAAARRGARSAKPKAAAQGARPAAAPTSLKINAGGTFKMKIERLAAAEPPPAPPAEK